MVNGLYDLHAVTVGRTGHTTCRLTPSYHQTRYSTNQPTPEMITGHVAVIRRDCPTTSTCRWSCLLKHWASTCLTSSGCGSAPAPGWIFRVWSRRLVGPMQQMMLPTYSSANCSTWQAKLTGRWIWRILGGASLPIVREVSPCPRLRSVTRRCWWFRDAASGSTHSVHGPSLWPARRIGTAYQTAWEIRILTETTSDVCWRCSCLLCTEAFSVFGMFQDDTLYKLTY